MIARKLALPVLGLISLITATALSCSGISNLPNPFASATPTVTETFTPSATPTPTATSTFTPTATPEPTGMAIHNVPGGGSQFLDYDGRYTMEIPSEWVAVQADPESMRSILDTAGKNNPGLKTIIEAIQAAKSQPFRIFAFDKDPSHQSKGYVPNINVLMVQDPVLIKLPLDVVLASQVEQMKAQIPGLTIKQLPTTANPHGVQIGATESQLSMKVAVGTTMALYEKQFVFQTTKAMVVVTFSAAAANASTVLPFFDKIADGVELMKP